MWHDTDANGIVSPTRIMAYMQETGNLQCDHYGFNLDRKHKEEGIGFILSNISVNINRPMHAFERIKVSTWCAPSRAYSFKRYFEIERDGEVIASAYSLWALVSINTRTLIKGDESLDEYFPIDEPLDISALPPRAKRIKGEELCLSYERRIGFSDIDYNMHMNNTRYPDMICDSFGDMTGKRVKSFSLSYLKEAAFGDNIAIYRSEMNGDGYIGVEIQNAQSEVCLEGRFEITDI